MDIASIRGKLLRSTVSMVLTIVLLGGIFTALFYLWASRNVTRPLEQLENSVRDFANSCQDQKDPEALHIDVPEISANNEVKSLATAVTKMSEAMQGYVKSIVSTKSELASMAVLANKDALTSVGNKNAYDAYTVKLKARMHEHDSSFALAMVDLNNLKKINDAYGHEKGDIYIQQCCAVICDTFGHSPVFRIGGDEFVVVMLDRDFENRAELVQKVRAEFARRASDESKEPWERCSAAIGIEEFDEAVDHSIEEMLDHADKNMYAEKVRMKRDAR